MLAKSSTIFGCHGKQPLGQLMNKNINRRLFLKFIAGSPLLAATGLRADNLSFFVNKADKLQPLDHLVDSAEKAINVFDFEAIAREKLSPAHYGFLATGVEGERTLRANREGFERIYLRPRHLIDVSKIDMSTRILGCDHETPLILAPTSSHKAFHPEGEIAVAKALVNVKHMNIMASQSTSAIEDIITAQKASGWFQLYPTTDRNIAKSLISRAEAAGCQVVVLTVDVPSLENRDTMKRGALHDQRECSSCHSSGLKGFFRNKPMLSGLNLDSLKGEMNPFMTWEYVSWLKNQTTMKLFLKGIVTHEDALLSLKNGIDGIIVSNHGGRAEESGRAAVDSLIEVSGAVNKKIPVIMDGGIRRGSDIFKAIALGADAEAIGRPYLWGLAAFGQEGVEAVLKILRAELHHTMMVAGTPSLNDITKKHVGLL